MGSQLFDLSFRVLFYEEDGQCVAHALELDLVGVGDNAQEAEKELIDAIACQVSFAAHQKDPSLVNQRAPYELFQRWEDAQKQALMAAASGERCEHWQFRAAVVDVTPKKIKEVSRRQFMVGEPAFA